MPDRTRRPESAPRREGGASDVLDPDRCTHQPPAPSAGGYVRFSALVALRGVSSTVRSYVTRSVRLSRSSIEGDGTVRSPDRPSPAR